MITIHRVLQKALSWALLLFVLLMQGCLTIEENYTFKKDGSGTMEYVVDMSEMADLMKGLPGANGSERTFKSPLGR